MYVNGIMLLVGVSKHIVIIQYVCIREKSGEKRLHTIFIMIHKYQARGIFDVISIGNDKSFDPIESKFKDEPYNLKLTVCDANPQVEFIKRMILFVKERIQAV